METDICTIDWTAISAIATAVMACFTFFNIKHSKKQLDELKRQWQEQNRPRLMPLLVSHNGRSANGYLRIKNISNTPAYGVSIKIHSHDEAVTNDDYILYKDLVETLQKTTFTLEPLGVKDFKFIDTIWDESKYEGKLDIFIEYNGMYSEKFTLSMSEYTILWDSITNENAIAEKIEQLRRTIEDTKCPLR